jgi:7,8-dihydropterin-6-yl-methyl-4-(beta-D-ribofuranosyl)aminobenzene 5'-phosphate synthase
MSDLVEIDSLTALVIIDNEIDVMSTIAPDTVEVSGQLPHIAVASRHYVSGRGDATKEISLEDICCGAWGFSVLLVSQFLELAAPTLSF